MSVAAHSSAPVRLPAIGRPDVAPRYAHGHGHAAVRSPPTMPIRLPSYKELTAKARCEEVVGPGPALPMPPPPKSSSPSSSNAGLGQGGAQALGLGGGGVSERDTREREGREKPRSSLFTAGLIHLPPLTGLLKPAGNSANSSPATTPRPSLSSSTSSSSPSGIQRLLSGQAPRSPQASGSVRKGCHCGKKDTRHSGIYPSARKGTRRHTNLTHTRILCRARYLKAILLILTNLTLTLNLSSTLRKVKGSSTLPNNNLKPAHSRATIRTRSRFLCLFLCLYRVPSSREGHTHSRCLRIFLHLTRRTPALIPRTHPCTHRRTLLNAKPNSRLNAKLHAKD
ncbi:hypothetical protein DFH06DRAFT_1320486 [Mycena polygramma]|nr:hypothetical protein DFH06DRAFT_1320486 [Mycena polygramma]